MTIHLPDDLERFVQSEVQKGRFASPDEAVVEAVRLLQKSRLESSPERKLPGADELNRQLLEAGLLTQIPARPDPETYEEFSPVSAKGEPVSETIIRERR